MHPTPFQLWWKNIKTNITNDSGNYNVTDLSLYKDRMMKYHFVNSYEEHQKNDHEGAVLSEYTHDVKVTCNATNNWYVLDYAVTVLNTSKKMLRVSTRMGYYAVFLLNQPIRPTQPGRPFLADIIPHSLSAVQSGSMLLKYPRFRICVNHINIWHINFCYCYCYYTVSDGFSGAVGQLPSAFLVN